MLANGKTTSTMRPIDSCDEASVADSFLILPRTYAVEPTIVFSIAKPRQKLIAPF